ncbi:MAG: phosphopentomutase [Granulosicoccaceae bacterium]
MTSLARQRRALIIVMDSVGIGGAPDAAAFGDEGSCTVGHIAEECAAGRADIGRNGPLRLPNLAALGLGAACEQAWGRAMPPLTSKPCKLLGQWGSAIENSGGKDSPSGHWELAGLPVESDWGYFPDKTHSFPPELLAEICRRADLPGLLGNCHSSGTEVLDDVGERSHAEGMPIVYTSTDSVFQIAAHEESFGLERLYKLCELVRELVDEYRVGRVIARPFTGSNRNNFKRTHHNRRDYAVPPHGPILFDCVNEVGGFVTAIGKISDLYAGQGVGKKLKASGLDGLMRTTFDALASTQNSDRPELVMTNLVDFDQEYGHRRDVPGYARELEAFDAYIPQLQQQLAPNDLLIITADHGCDPTWFGTDHTREQVPVLCWSPGCESHALGVRHSFADVGQSVASWLGATALLHGQSFFDDPPTQIKIAQ